MGKLRPRTQSWALKGGTLFKERREQSLVGDPPGQRRGGGKTLAWGRAKRGAEEGRGLGAEGRGLAAEGRGRRTWRGGAAGPGAAGRRGRARWAVQTSPDPPPISGSWGGATPASAGCPSPARRSQRPREAFKHLVATGVRGRGVASGWLSSPLRPARGPLRRNHRLSPSLSTPGPASGLRPRA